LRVETVADAVDAYQAARRPDLSFESARNLKYTFRRFVDVIGPERPIGELDEDAIDRWRQALPTRLAARTLRHEIGRVREFTRWCHRHGKLLDDPCMHMRLPHAPRSLPRELEEPQLEKAELALPDDRARLIVSLMHMEGLRCIEVARLETGDVDRIRRAIHVVGKGGHHREVPLSERTATAIDAYSDGLAGPLVRNHKHGGPLTAKTISRMVSDWFKAAGVKRKPHDGMSAHAYRHTAAGEMLDADTDLRDVSTFLGHGSLAVTSIYLKRRASVERLAEAMARRETGA